MAEKGAYPRPPHRGAPPPMPPTSRPLTAGSVAVPSSQPRALHDQFVIEYDSAGPRLGRAPGAYGVRTTTARTSRQPGRLRARRRVANRPGPKRPSQPAGRPKVPCIWISTKRCTRRAPCAGSGRTRSPSTSRPASSMRPSAPPRAATSRTGVSSSLDDPAKKAALAPLYQHAMGELWKIDLQGPARRRPRRPRRTRVRRRSSRSSARPSGWPTTSRTSRSTCSRSASTTRPGGSIYPAVWSAMLAARAEGVGSCLTALLQFFHPAETFEILGVPDRRGLDPLGHGELRLPDRHLGRRRRARPVARGRRTATPGAPTSASRCPNPCGRADRAHGAVRRHRAARRRRTGRPRSPPGPSSSCSSP